MKKTVHNDKLSMTPGVSLLKTAHFIERQQQRRIPDSIVQLALTCGERFYQGTEQVYFLGRRHLERARRRFGIVLSDSDASRADGTVVVVGNDTYLVTTYRNPEYIRHLRRCVD